MAFSISSLRLFAVLLAAVVAARANDYVVVSSTAARDYSRTTSADHKIAPQSYTFTAGNHMSGATRDTSEETMPFQTLVNLLAPALAKQQYYPATVPDDAELLIAVHWGTTHTYEDPNRHATQERFNAAMGAGDVEAVNNALLEQGSENMTTLQYQDRNAAILGYARTLNAEATKANVTVEEISMRNELQEDRYFVVLVAYDYQFLKQHKKKKVRWVTHISVRSPGNNFNVAMPLMARAGSEFFGKNVDQLARLETVTREGRVTVGEPRVIPTTTEKPKRR